MNVGVIVIDLIITIFVYLAFPTIYFLVKGKIPIRKAKKIALLNSIICKVLFLSISFLINDGVAISTNFAPAVLYYFIAKAIMGDKNLKEDEIANTEEDTESYTLCDKCGSQIFEDDTFCPNCNSKIKQIEIKQEEIKADTNNRKSKKYKLKRYK